LIQISIRKKFKNFKGHNKSCQNTFYKKRLVPAKYSRESPYKKIAQVMIRSTFVLGKFYKTKDKNKY